MVKGPLLDFCNVPPSWRRSSSQLRLGPATEIMWWHAMSGELGRQLDKLSRGFQRLAVRIPDRAELQGELYRNRGRRRSLRFARGASPPSFRSAKLRPATMMAAKGATYPVFELMRDESEAFSPAAYLPAVSGYYADVDGNMLSFPFNASTPILYYNKDMFRAAGLDPEIAPKTWPEVGAAAKRLRAARAACGFTTSWPSWINVENFSGLPQFADLDQGQRLRRPRCGAHFQRSVDGSPHCALAEWQTTKLFDYSGRATSGGAAVSKRRMRNLYRVVGDARRYQGQFEIRGRLRHVAITGPMSRARRKTPASVARHCGCCATGRAPNTRASPSSSPTCRSRKFRPPGISTRGICR